MIALGQMVSGITHDINNALMPIMGTSDLLLNNSDLLTNRDVVERSLRTILAASCNARDIIRRLREYYRPADPESMDPIHLQALAQSVIELSEPSWKADAATKGKHITIQKQFAPEPLMVKGNTSDLREMLMNLLLNAVDAIEGKGLICLNLLHRDRNAVIELIDTGGGMPDEVLKNCFEPFFSTKGNRGSGLGLSVCHGVVQRLRGNINVKSSPGDGTTFTITLPLLTPSQASDPVDTHDDQPSPPTRTPTLHILVVDDDPPSCTLLTRYLQKAGHSVVSLNHAQAALETLEASHFDLLLTDRAMPGISGDELARKARQLRPSIHTIMLTGFADIMALQNDLPNDIDAVLSKPITADELMQAIHQLINANA